MDFIKENLLIIGIGVLALILLVVAIKLFIELKHSKNKHAKTLKALKSTASDALKNHSSVAGKTMADLHWHNDKYNDKYHEVIGMKKVLAEIISKLHQYALYGFISFLICIFAFKIQVSVIFQSITNLSTFQNIFFAYTAISTILLLPLIAILAIG